MFQLTKSLSVLTINSNYQIPLHHLPPFKHYCTSLKIIFHNPTRHPHLHAQANRMAAQDLMQLRPMKNHVRRTKPPLEPPCNLRLAQQPPIIPPIDIQGLRQCRFGQQGWPEPPVKPDLDGVGSKLHARADLGELGRRLQECDGVLVWWAGECDSA